MPYNARGGFSINYAVFVLDILKDKHIRNVYSIVYYHYSYIIVCVRACGRACVRARACMCVYVNNNTNYSKKK